MGASKTPDLIAPNTGIRPTETNEQCFQPVGKISFHHPPNSVKYQHLKERNLPSKIVQHGVAMTVNCLTDYPTTLGGVNYSSTLFPERNVISLLLLR